MASSNRNASSQPPDWALIDSYVRYVAVAVSQRQGHVLSPTLETSRDERYPQTPRGARSGCGA